MNEIKKVVCIFEVAGMPAREGPQERIYIFGDVVSGTVAVGDYWSARRDLQRDCPSEWIFVNFGYKIELPRSRVLWAQEKITLFCCDEIY